ncbi:MAG: hypothetical protein M1821_005117 [Bathelium mastoideum]|nr:MAG: hypothetical protein M1821_005117 [Bathelium mastoideum]
MRQGNDSLGMSSRQEKLEIRKENAEDLLRRALAKGKTLKGIDEIKKFLQESAQKRDWGKDYFHIFEDKDYFDAYLAAHAVGPRPTPAPRPGIDVLTPPGSVTSVELQPDLQRAGSFGAEDSQGICYEDPEQHFLVRIQHSSSNHLEMATASRCKGEESFVSERNLARWNLSSYLDDEDTI